MMTWFHQDFASMWKTKNSYLLKDFGIYGLEKVLVTTQQSEQKVANSMIMSYS